ncbi:MAG: DMT family transporter [Candidatus Latescibacterota bacterium]|nr:DMT family transporter [Candidatus Latescibacterota bacterium]
MTTGSPPVHRRDRIGASAAALALMTSVLWGGNQVAIKLGLEAMPPLAMAGARFGIGLLVVVGAAAVARVSLRMRPGELAGLAGLAILFVVQIGTLNVGTVYTSASRSTVAISAYPFFTALFAHLFIPGDRLSATKVAGMVLAFAGVVLLMADGLIADAGVLGDAIVLTSAILLGLRQTVLKRLVHDAHPYKVLFWQSCLSLPVFVALSLMFESSSAYAFTWRATGGILYQGIAVAGICFIVLVFLFTRHSASQLGTFGFVNPVVGVYLSAWIIGDELSPQVLVSTALVATGIVFCTRELQADEAKE